MAAAEVVRLSAQRVTDLGLASAMLAGLPVEEVLLPELEVLPDRPGVRQAEEAARLVRQQDQPCQA